MDNDFYNQHLTEFKELLGEDKVVIDNEDFDYPDESLQYDNWTIFKSK